MKTGDDLDFLKKEMEKDLTLIQDWLNANKLSLSVVKTKTIVFCTKQKNKNPEIDVKLDDKIIKQVKSTKFLGMHVNQNLVWTEHIKHVQDKIATVSGIIYRSKHILPQSTSLQIYNSLALPHLLYCNPIWGGTYPTHIDPIIKSQKRIIRNITGSEFLAHTSPLFKNLSTLKFTDLTELETLKIIHKYDNKKLPANLQNTYIKSSEIHSYDTRHKENYHLKKFSTNITASTSVFNRGFHLWNNLDNTLHSETSLPKFCSKLKKDYLSKY